MKATPFSFAAPGRQRILRIPAGILTKAGLFEAYRSLPLPEHFGANWDAFDECLTDLSFVDADRLTIEHEALPALDRDDLVTYLEILVDAVEARPADPQLEVIFAPSDAEAIATLLALASEERD